MDIIALNLPRTMTKKELSTLFARYGKVTSCTVVIDKITNASKGFGFVTMADETEARAAIEALHGSKIGAKVIRVKASTDAGD